MSRIVDEPYFTYNAYNALTSGIQVKCPKCHGAGVVTADDGNAYFLCLSCGHQMCIRDRSTLLWTQLRLPIIWPVTRNIFTKMMR